MKTLPHNPVRSYDILLAQKLLLTRYVYDYHDPRIGYEDFMCARWVLAG